MGFESSRVTPRQRRAKTRPNNKAIRAVISYIKAVYSSQRLFSSQETMGLSRYVICTSHLPFIFIVHGTGSVDVTGLP